MVGRNRDIVKRNTGTESPGFVVVVGGTQRDTVGVFKAFVFIEQLLTV